MHFGFERHLRPGSIRVKLTLLVATIVAATAGLTFWFAYSQMSGDLEREIDHRLSVVAKDRVELLRSHLQSQQVQVGLIGRSPQMRDLMRSREQTQLDEAEFRAAAWLVLDGARQHAQDLAALCLLDTEKRVVASTTIDWLGQPSSECFGEPLPAEPRSVGPLWMLDNLRVGLVTEDITSGDGRSMGTLVAVSNFEPVLQLVEAKGDLGASARMLIAARSDDGIQFFSPEIGFCPTPFPVIEAALDGTNGVLHDEARFGQPILAACQSVGHAARIG